MKIKITLIVLTGLALLAIMLLATQFNMPRYVQQGTPPGCHYQQLYGCSLPVGFRGWPQFP